MPPESKSNLQSAIPCRIKTSISWMADRPPLRPSSPIINKGSDLSRFRSEDRQVHSRALGSQPRPPLLTLNDDVFRAPIITNEVFNDERVSIDSPTKIYGRFRTESSLCPQKLDYTTKRASYLHRSLAGSSPEPRRSFVRTSTDSKVVEYHWDQASIDRLGRLEEKFSWLCAQLGISFKEEEEEESEVEDEECESDEEEEEEEEEDNDDDLMVVAGGPASDFCSQVSTMKAAHHVFAEIPELNLVQFESKVTIPATLHVASSSSKPIPGLFFKFPNINKEEEEGDGSAEICGSEGRTVDAARQVFVEMPTQFLVQSSGMKVTSTLSNFSPIFNEEDNQRISANYFVLKLGSKKSFSIALDPPPIEVPMADWRRIPRHGAAQFTLNLFVLERVVLWKRKRWKFSIWWSSTLRLLRICLQ